jgi:hypothetical protein
MWATGKEGHESVPVDEASESESQKLFCIWGKKTNVENAYKS